MEADRHAIPITDADLDAVKDKAEKQISMINGSLDLEQVLKGLAPEESYRILPIELELIYSIRHATCLYIWMGLWLFEKTGQKEEAANSVVPTDSIVKKQKFSSSYALYIMASYIINDCDELLKGKKTENLTSIQPNFRFEPGRNFTQDLQILLSYYVDALKSTNESGVPNVKSALDIISITRDYWKVVADRAIDTVKKTDAVIQAVVLNTTFKHNEFIIHGLEIEHATTNKAISFAPVQPEEVVGNTEAVIMLLRLCDRLALYDAELKNNPLCEIGGIYESNLLDGPPGTGKTTLTKMAMTRLAKRAEQVGLSCTFKNLDAASCKSEWFGKSSKLLAEIITSVLDPSTLSLLLVDDIDLLLSNRDDPGSGGADKDLLKGLMDFFSGIGTNYKGNYSSVAATNKPTGVDDALRQRFVYRVMVTGAETWEDYADLVAIQLRKPVRYGLVKIDEKGYRPLQRTRPKLLTNSKIYTKSGTWSDVGHHIMELQKKSPNFTARSVKNAIDVVVAKAGDFEVPEMWFLDPAIFRAKSWDDRVNMVKELYGNISTDTIINSIQDQYDSEIRYSEVKYVNKN
jgi:Cdc6-like AAA superfamily ATPase